MASPGIQYEYIGNAAFFVDAHAGSRKIWQGKGDVQSIDAAFVPVFERIYVNCEGAQMRRVTSDAGLAKATPDEDVVPGGTAYSGYNAAQLRVIYTQKTGKHPAPKMTAAAMVKEIQAADAGLNSDLDL